MKNLSLVLNAVLLIAVAFLFVREFSGGADASGQKQQAGANGAKAKVMAYVNVDTLYAYYEYYQEIKSNLEEKSKKASVDLESRANKFAKKRDNFIRQAQGGLLSNNEAQQREQQLMQEGQELERYKRSAQQGLVAFEQEQQEKLYERITEFVEEYNQDKGYSYIVGYQYGGNFWYTEDSHDITNEVIEGLNAEYKAEQGEGDEK